MLKTFSLIFFCCVVVPIEVAAQSNQISPSTTAIPAEVAARIAALKSKGGSDPWDDEVKPLIIAAFDKNDNGRIDTTDELIAIPCEVWVAMDKSIRAGSKESGLIWTYGFDPHYEWVGDAFGLDERLRKQVFERVLACGVSPR